jgi:hypothetical protein
MKTIISITATVWFAGLAGAQLADPIRESSIRLGGAWDEAHGFAQQVEMWRIDMDLNGDGVDDLLVTRDVARDGKAGNIWDVYLSGNHGYYRLAQSVSFRPDLFLLDSYKGNPAIYAFWPESSEDGRFMVIYVEGDQVRAVAINQSKDPKDEEWMTKLSSFKTQNEAKIKKFILHRPLPEHVSMEIFPQTNFIKRVTVLWTNGNILEIYDIACRRLSLNTNDLPGLILKMNCELHSENWTLSIITIDRILAVGATVDSVHFSELFTAARDDIHQYQLQISEKRGLVDVPSLGNGKMMYLELLEALESDGYFTKGNSLVMPDGIRQPLERGGL